MLRLERGKEQKEIAMTVNQSLRELFILQESRHRDAFASNSVLRRAFRQRKAAEMAEAERAAAPSNFSIALAPGHGAEAEADAEEAKRISFVTRPADTRRKLQRARILTESIFPKTNDDHDHNHRGSAASGERSSSRAMSRKLKHAQAQLLAVKNRQIRKQRQTLSLANGENTRHHANGQESPSCSTATSHTHSPTIMATTTSSSGTTTSGSSNTTTSSSSGTSSRCSSRTRRGSSSSSGAGEVDPTTAKRRGGASGEFEVKKEKEKE
eukprot:GHVT01055523.1.p1 GENE.GHVT01055523.1~~GHVT01055523.1.p1  ORF type:complete len:268 (+),score=81.66 GHVT01055523.1:178-981(+)